LKRNTQIATGMISHIRVIYLEDKSAFAASIGSSLTERGFTTEVFNESAEQIEAIDGVVLFHENHNFDRHIAELRDLFDKRQVATHKIDMSGTMNVALSHLSLFFDRIKCKNVLFLGSENLKDNPKLEIFKEKWHL